MSILQQLQKSKGTISTTLGKSLAEKVLKGDITILKEAVLLIRFNDKNVRAGAAKIIEKVAEKKPEIVADYLEDILPGLEVTEPQTKWMIIHTLGLCAKVNTSVSLKAFDKAKTFLGTDSGVCLWDRTILYLGYIGAVSKEYTKEVFPILEKVLVQIPSQTKTVLESFERITQVFDDETNKKILKYAQRYSIQLQLENTRRVKVLMAVTIWQVMSGSGRIPGMIGASVLCVAVLGFTVPTAAEYLIVTGTFLRSRSTL